MSRQVPADIRDGDLAVIGLSCRFPGAPTPHDYWQLLRDGREGTRQLDDESLIARGVDRRIFTRSDYVRACADLSDIEWFDAAFFGSSPAEAEMMDPQHRLFLETAWHALEDAALDPSQFSGPIACFAGKTLNAYIAGAIRGEDDAATSLLSLLGNDKDYLATQVSYKLDLRGPSATVQTACSTSLVAIHMACQSLLNGECDAAIAGGVSIRLPHGVGYVYQPGMVFSPDGRCRAFDAGANGMLSGSGVGVVVIRRAVDAVEAGDPIRAIIRGTAVNNDGARKVGFTAPSVDGQAAVVAEALAVAGVDPETLSYIEAHGTGTPLGDPIEIAALTRVLGDRPGSRRLSLGSVKTNFGHLDAAAGVAGLIKAILALQHRQLPPTLHFTRPNPEIDFTTGRFEVQTALADWPSDRGPRRAGVSSFGIGGTNAHAVLQEAPAVPATAASTRAQLFPLSARSAEALIARSSDLVQHLGEHPALSAADVAWTLQTGRRAFEHRRAIVATTIEEVRAALSAPAVTGHAQPRSLVFMFPGQGAQYAGMARGLSATYPEFRASFDRCLDLIASRLGTDLRKIMFDDASGDVLRQTQYAQPALFAAEYSLAVLLTKWLGRPAAVIGHSVGEYAAACLAGVFSLDDAVSLVVERGRLMQAMPAGAMLAVAASETEISRFLDARIELAAVNGPSQCVVAGPADAIDALESNLASSGMACHPLKTSHAFHSASMDAAAAAFAERVAQTTRHAPKIPVISNVTGQPLTAAEAVDPQYWARQLRATVRFADGVGALLGGDHRLLLEVGPGATLQGLVRRNSAFGDAHAVVSTMRQEHEDRSDESKLLDAVGQAWTNGAAVDWRQMAGDDQRQRLALPVYSFVRQRYWREPGIAAMPSADLERIDLEQWFHVPGWKRVAPTASSVSDRAATGEWIVVGGDRGPAVSVIAKLRARGLPVTVVTRGHDSEAVLAGMAARSGEPLHIVHALALGDHVSFDAAQESGFYSVLDLARAIGRSSLGRDVRLTVLSSGVYDVTGAETLDPRFATLLGAVKVIPQEHPQIRTRHLDLEHDAAPRIIVEALTDDRLPSTLAIRGSYMWEQTYERVTLAPVASDAVPAALRHNGVYLLTGGLGAIGFTLSRYLAQRVSARLVLVSRGPMTESKLARVRELESLGGEVLVTQADVADENQMRQAIETAKARFGQLNGVIHVAGERHTASIDDTTRELCEAQFRSKAHGTVVLDRVLADEPIDFCHVVSSMASVLGGIGLAAYTASHAFADAWVQQHNRVHPVRWVSVNWDNWLADDGSDQFAGIEISSGHRHREAADAFERLAAHGGLPQVLISTVDLQARITRWIELDFLRDGNASAAGTGSRYQRPQLTADYVAPETELAKALAGLWQELLQIDRIGIHDNFFELGGDSVISIRFLAKAARAGIRLSTRDVFERQTIAQLCAVAVQTESVAPGAEQGVVTGEAPLTPMQHWLVEQHLAQPSFFNQAMVYETPLGVVVPHLQQAVQALVDHHDGLRLALIRSGQDWRQHIGPLRKVALDVFDLSHEPEARQRQAIGERIAELHRGLDLNAGDIVRFAYFDVGPHPGWLAIIVHHAAIDGFAWRIISEDLASAYQQAAAGRSVVLPEKTTSALAWAGGLQKLAAGSPPSQQVEFWTRPEYRQATAFPRDVDGGLNTAGSVETLEVALDEQTTAGLARVARDYETRIEVLMQAALARTLSRATASATALFDCEGHGRDGLVDGVDLSRTVAWCTAIYPVAIAVADERTASVEDWIRAAHDQIAAIPEKGAAYGVMRYLAAEPIASRLRSMPAAEVVHCHLGQVEAAAGAFKPIHQQQFLAQGPDDERRWLLEADTVIYQGRLVSLWRFSRNIHQRGTIDRLAHDFMETLRAFVSHVPSRRRRAADFPQADLDQDELDELVAELSGLDEDER